MNKKILSLAIIAAFANLGIGWAGDMSAMVNNNDDLLKRSVDVDTNEYLQEQRAAEAKVAYKQAKADYEKSLRENGGNSAATVSAKKRMNEARSKIPTTPSNGSHVLDLD